MARARRILSVWLPRFAAEWRLRRMGGVEGPFAVVAEDAGALVLTSVNGAAAGLGLGPGMGLSDARAMQPDLVTRPAAPEREAAALGGLARWAGRWSPFTAPEGTDVLVMDVSGCAHLFGGEAALMAEVTAALSDLGFAARAALADTRGAAWALARYAPVPAPAGGFPASPAPGEAPTGGQEAAPHASAGGMSHEPAPRAGPPMDAPPGKSPPKHKPAQSAPEEPAQSAPEENARTEKGATGSVHAVGGLKAAAEDGAAAKTGPRQGRAMNAAPMHAPARAPEVAPEVAPESAPAPEPNGAAGSAAPIVPPQAATAAPRPAPAGASASAPAGAPTEATPGGSTGAPARSPSPASRPAPRAAAASGATGVARGRAVPAGASVHAPIETTLERSTGVPSAALAPASPRIPAAAPAAARRSVAVGAPAPAPGDRSVSTPAAGPTPGPTDAPVATPPATPPAVAPAAPQANSPAPLTGEPAAGGRSGDAIAPDAHATRVRTPKRRRWTRPEPPMTEVQGGAQAGVIAPVGGARAALAPLPVAALRLPPEVVTRLQRLGLRRIEELMLTPRAGLARRFGIETPLRLDQALGMTPEPISPRRDEAPLAVRISFPEPVGLAADIEAATLRLLQRLETRLTARGLGARRLRLALSRVDGAAEVADIGLARPGRDPARIAALFAPKIAGLDAGFGIDAARIAVTAAEPLAPAQHRGHLEAQADAAARLAPGGGEAFADLLSRIGGRVGLERITRPLPAESHIPEKAWITAAAAYSAPHPGGWPDRGRRRPLSLFPPEIAEVTRGEGPGRPPAALRWRGRTRALTAAAGPERIAPEWWLDDPAWRSGPRDYWRVEAEDGERLWLFEAKGGERPGGWFVQGVFA